MLTGQRAGEVVEDVHFATMWTPDTWRAGVQDSPLTQLGCFDGALPERPAADPDEGGGLLWHELAAA